MPKFSATSINDLRTDERNVGRRARGVEWVVACEASDGSWCEFDGDDYLHAKRLADSAVDNLGARGCTVWHVCRFTGAMRERSVYFVTPNEEGPGHA